MNRSDRVAVDSNVLDVANGRAPQASDECVISAVEFLQDARQKAVVLLDSGGEIFNEYRSRCNFRGQPGVGDWFFRHLHQSQGDRNIVAFVDIDPDGNGSYAQIPDALKGFDPSDQKFVAVIIADGGRAKIVNCVDSDWRQFEEQFRSSGVQVVELCPSCLKAV